MKLTLALAIRSAVPLVVTLNILDGMMEDVKNGNGDDESGEIHRMHMATELAIGQFEDVIGFDGPDDVTVVTLYGDGSDDTCKIRAWMAYCDVTRTVARDGGTLDADRSTTLRTVAKDGTVRLYL